MNIDNNNTFFINLPSPVAEIISTIESNGFEAFAVGGCVRDTLLNRSPDDWDITTSALPEQVKAMFPRTIDTGIQHGTVTVMIGKNGYETTTYRIDGEYEDGRHPKSVEFSSRLLDDLKRRDFTINAMAYNNTTHLVDEFGGISDLNHKIIRCVGNAAERFSEDALRMMRAIRFSAQLGFTIEDATYEAILTLAPTLSKVSMERVEIELGKTLVSKNPDYVLKFVETGLFKEKLPLIHSILSDAHKIKTLAMLRTTKPSLILRLSALLNCASPDEARHTLRSLKLDNHTVDTVTKLVKYSKHSIDETEPAVREALHKFGKDFFFILLDHQEAGLAAREETTGIILPSLKMHFKTLRKLASDSINRGDCFTIKALEITGHDLIEYGLTGPAIGKALDNLLHMVIEDPKLNNKEMLIDILKQL
ncbi:MAG: CCA tRNA nucleotidyltransferase [Eubacteriales bacterium]|nr:CCA tRNA nucleotidyltransferase [Eubacteriales bacterium]